MDGFNTFMNRQKAGRALVGAALGTARFHFTPPELFRTLPPMNKSLAALAAALLLPIALPAAETQPLRALMVCGGCCHDFTNQKGILSEGIAARANVEFTIVQEGSDKTNRVSIYEKPDWWKGYDVILHNECFGFVDDDKFIENIAAAHASGVPGVMLHCSTHSYRMGQTDAWRQTLGLRSMSHDKARDLTVKNKQAAHPIMKAFPAEWLDPKDELYRNEKVWPTFKPLATAFSEESKKDHVVVWVNTYGNTRIFATTLGHSNETMKSPVYLDLVTRGLLWACDKLNDEGKPKAGFAAVKK
jgi:type 1 glutamine amidotransferase